VHYLYEEKKTEVYSSIERCFKHEDQRDRVKRITVRKKYADILLIYTQRMGLRNKKWVNTTGQKGLRLITQKYTL
jgi:hypothetical protein